MDYFAVSFASRLAANSCECAVLRLCLLAWILVCSSHNRARALFCGGMVSGLLLWPLRMLWPQLAVPLTHVDAFGLAAALFAALSLLLDTSGSVNSGGTTDVV